MSSIVILGGRGYIAGKLRSVFPDAQVPDVDIADAVSLARMLDTLRPEIVINTAGKTGRPNVDWCEDHRIETMRSNLTGPLILLEECMRRNVYVVHIGSGCIYQGAGGRDGFTEEDPPNFQASFYSFTKLLSEAALKPFPVLQLRLRMPFDGEPHPRNLITKLSRYTKVLDAENSLTYLPDLLRVAQALVHRRATGIYNVTNPGSMSPYRLMELYKKYVDPSHQFERIAVDDLPTVAKAARSNCILSSKKLENEGLAMQPVESVVQEALQIYAKRKS